MFDITAWTVAAACDLPTDELCKVVRNLRIDVMQKATTDPTGRFNRELNALTVLTAELVTRPKDANHA